MTDFQELWARAAQDRNTLDAELTRQEIRIAELEEMLTAATDAIDELAASVVYWRDSYYRIRENRDSGPHCGSPR